MSRATDAALRLQAQQLAAKLFFTVARRLTPDGGGVGRMTRSRFIPDGRDLDVEASLTELIAARGERRAIDPDRLVARHWGQPSTAWCLLVDRSASMNGASVATAAIAAAAISLRATNDFAVLVFARGVVVLKSMTARQPDLVDRLLQLRARGTTDMSAALESAAQQFRASSARRQITVLLSDCKSNQPGDALAAARGLDELVILAPPGDIDPVGEFAEQARARWAVIDGPKDVAAALGRVLAQH